MYFMGVIETTFLADSLNDCGTYCVRSLDCVFANYNVDQRSCQIMSSIADSKNSISDQQWTVLITDPTNNKNIGPICENNTPCENLYCRDVCSQNGLVHIYQCLANNEVSRGAAVTISSIFQNKPAHVPSKAVDGDLATITATDIGEMSWFKLDLHYVYQLTKIVIYNRNDCCQNGMNGSILIVSENDQYLNALNLATLTADYEQIFTGSYIARCIFVTKKEFGVLAIAEIYVYV
ncbi:uncharacterized protein LOC136090466 isoform X2 [Hydra vulgaris]